MTCQCLRASSGYGRSNGRSDGFHSGSVYILSTWALGEFVVARVFRLVVDYNVYDLNVVKHNLVCVAMNIEMAWDFF